MSHLLIKPLITEKSMADAARGVYTFVVAQAATKSQLRELVNELFKVHVVKVTTSTTTQPSRRTGRRRLVTTAPPQKLARFFLKKGESISLFDLKEDN